MSALVDPAVLIVGAGPAGLAAARALAERGVGPVVIVERDDAPGGLPRYCRHPGFGWEYSRRLENGPAMVRRLLAALDRDACRILSRTTATALRPGPLVELVGPETGLAELRPRAVILATGIRERPRPARLVPGSRPAEGVLTTGLLQQMVTRGLRPPGPRAVVVGSEHVAFSALLTARPAGLRVVEMLEPGERILSYPVLGALARWAAGIPVALHSRVEAVLGTAAVEGVLVAGPGGTRRIDCEAVVFTGDFVPDAPLARDSGIEMDPATGGPAIDQLMRSSLPGVFAAGNLLRPVESSGIAALEGARAGACAAAYLHGSLDWQDPGEPISLARELLYLVPQRWAFGLPEPLRTPPLRPSLRVRADCAGARIYLRLGDRVLWHGPRKQHLRERRVGIDLGPVARSAGGSVSVSLG